MVRRALYIPSILIVFALPLEVYGTHEHHNSNETTMPNSTPRSAVPDSAAQLAAIKIILDTLMNHPNSIPHALYDKLIALTSLQPTTDLLPDQERAQWLDYLNRIHTALERMRSVICTYEQQRETRIKQLYHDTIAVYACAHEETCQWEELATLSRNDLMQHIMHCQE